MQRMGSVPILCVNVNVMIDTMLKFEANADVNVEIDAKCERTFRDHFVCSFFLPNRRPSISYR